MNKNCIAYLIDRLRQHHQYNPVHIDKPLYVAAVNRQLNMLHDCRTVSSRSKDFYTLRWSKLACLDNQRPWNIEDWLEL